MARDSDPPFRVLVIGDFSGRFGASRENPDFTPRVVDRDNFDDVLRAMRVSLDVGGRRIGFAELDDFHPDQLLKVLGPVEDGEAHIATPADLLSAIIAEQDGGEDEDDDPLDAASDLSRFVERATAGHLVAAPDAKQVQREERRRAAQADKLRALLHDPKFQALEAAWRGLFFLVREVDTGSDLKIYVLD
jgi:type VI secretion system protein ImpC